MAVVTQEEIDATQNTSASVSGTEGEIIQSRLGKKRRTALVVTPVTAGVVVYLSLGDQIAALDKGIVLLTNQPMQDSDNGDYKCYQGAVRAIASGNGTVAITEKF